ncbi:unnamed protein product [Candida verbasci]|uniref:PH domain-containing protein n=1 Tax=Candida verbasci TaxID=1227364 RepID=A0A9W4TVC3_9ASCO|nr:unnamed protein product [Candida verbasci]
MNAVKKRIKSGTSPSNNLSSSPSSQHQPPQTSDSFEGLSPELIPIVTLLSSQSHRRYHEGIFSLYYDLNGDGKPADREWKEVYGILTGNQLAYWDAANLAQFKNNPEQLLETSAKPTYINFTDSVYNAMKILPAAKQNLDNVIIVSTTLKNRYILQFKSYKDLTVWYSSLRLSNYEYNSLQEAYTGALLSARGSRLSDIRTILAEKRFDHEDWVSIRYGSGMAWKRCYAVVEPSQLKKKSFTAGRILFYENDQKKKKQLMAVVTNATSVTAVYPQSHLLIDHSTMLKMEGFINFNSPSLSQKVSKKNLDDFKQTSIFLMPEQHSSVPGFDTLIRFLVPLLDSFGLYGRPKRLKANRNDIDSLLFGLPTLPRVHYLELDDILNLVQQRNDFMNWDLNTWTNNIKALLKSKIDRGYDGCGSSRGYAGALNSLNSPQLSGSPRFPSSSRSASSSLSKVSSAQSNQQPPLPPTNDLRETNKGFDKNINDLSIRTNGQSNFKPSVPIIVQNGGAGGIQQATTTTPNQYQTLAPALDSKLQHKSVQLDDIYQKYSDLKTPSDNYHDRDLSNSLQGINLNKSMYPKDDDGLFSEDESDDEKIDIRQIGKSKEPTIGTPTSGLQVPYIQNNNSGSYSSIMSPMAQFEDLKDQFKLVDKKIPMYNLENNSDESPPPPPIPKHETTSNFGGKLNVNEVTQGTRVPNQTQTSIHSESGRVSSGSDSLEEVIAPYPTVQPKPNNKPRFISSPNSSQNQVNKFHSPERKPPPAMNNNSIVYPVSPERLNNMKQSQENLNEVVLKSSSPPKQSKSLQSNPYEIRGQQIPTSQPQSNPYQKPQQQQLPIPQPQSNPYSKAQPQIPPQQRQQQQQYPNHHPQAPPQQQYRSVIPQNQQPRPMQNQIPPQQYQQQQARPVNNRMPPQQQQNPSPYQIQNKQQQPIPRSYGQPQLQQHLNQNQQPSQFRGYDQNQNQQYQYSYQPNSNQQPQPQPPNQMRKQQHPYAQYTDQYRKY